jgi:hypothetical protein
MTNSKVKHARRSELHIEKLQIGDGMNDDGGQTSGRNVVEGGDQTVKCNDDYGGPYDTCCGSKDTRL